MDDTRPVLITGSSGVIGRVLLGGLKLPIREFALPDDDARELQQMLTACTGARELIHLAWDARQENCASSELDPGNLMAAHNAYRAAAARGVRRVVMASSVHADDFSAATPEFMMHPDRLPTPTGPYGASKCAIEALGRHHAAQG